MGGSTPGATVQLKDEERRGLRQASEAQQVLARLVSILGTRGASLGKATVWTTMEMVDAQSLRLEIDKGVATYNAVMTRLRDERDNELKDYRGRRMKRLVDIVDSPRAQQLNFCLIPAELDYRNKIGKEGNVRQRWTYEQMESSLLALPIAIGSSVKEHTSCLCTMLKLERCFAVALSPRHTFCRATQKWTRKEPHIDTPHCDTL